MKMRIICAGRIHFNFYFTHSVSVCINRQVLMATTWHTHSTPPPPSSSSPSSKSKNKTNQPVEKMKLFETLYLLNKFENLNIWLLLPVWKIEQFGWAHVLWSDFRAAKNNRKWKMEMKEEKFTLAFAHQQAVFTLGTYTHTYFPHFFIFDRRILVPYRIFDNIFFHLWPAFVCVSIYLL